MKEATGEGSMTIITIVVIVALGLAAAVIIGYFITKAGDQAESANNNTKVQRQDGTDWKNNLFNGSSSQQQQG